MSQITIPAIRRPSIFQQVKQVQAVVGTVPTTEKLETNKRIRLELETVHDIVGQVKKEFSQRALANRDLQMKICSNKSQLAELLRQTGDVGSSLGSLSAFVSYYEHKHTKCSEHGDEFQKEAASVVLELCNFVEFVGEVFTFLNRLVNEMHNRSNNEDKLAKLLSITWAKAVELESETDSLTTRNAKLKAEFLDVGEQFEANFALIEQHKEHVECLASTLEDHQRISAADEDSLRAITYKCTLKMAEWQSSQTRLETIKADIESCKAAFLMESARLSEEIRLHECRLQSEIIKSDDFRQQIVSIDCSKLEAVAEKERNTALIADLEVKIEQAIITYKLNEKMRSDQEITIAELRNELSQVTADFEKAKLDSKQAEEDFCGRYQKKTSLMDNIFQLKQLECQLKLDLQQVNITLEERRSKVIENVRLAKCKLLALGEAEETAKLLLFQEVNREHWLFENINKSAEIVLKYQSDLEFLENKKTDFSVSLSKIEAEILCLEEEKEINVSLEAEIESLEQSEADWKVKNTELEANLAIFRSQYEETSTPNLFSVEYNPDSSKIAEVEVLVAKEKKLVDQRYSSSIKGVTLREMEANLIELRAGARAKYPGLIEKQDVELKKLTYDLATLEAKAQDHKAEKQVFSISSTDQIANRGSLASSEIFEDVVLGEKPTEKILPKRIIGKYNTGRGTKNSDTAKKVNSQKKRVAKGQTITENCSSSGHLNKISAITSKVKNTRIHRVAVLSTDNTTACLASATKKMPLPDWFDDECFSLR